MQKLPRKKERKNDTLVQNQQPKINKINNSNVSTYEHYACVVIGPRTVGKTYYMLKILEKIDSKRPIHVITRSPNQYPNYKTIKEYKPINKYKDSVVIFDDMLGARHCSQLGEFFTRGRHEDLDVFYISQSYFALPRQSIRNNSDRLILFAQALRDVQSMYYDIGAYVMKYVEFKVMCHKAWSERFNYLCIDMTKKKNQGKYRILMKTKPHTLNALAKLKLFKHKQ